MSSVKNPRDGARTMRLGWISNRLLSNNSLRDARAHNKTPCCEISSRALQAMMIQKTLHHPHERHARVNVGARPREVRTPTYKIPPVSPGSVKTCTTTLRHIAEEHNIVTLQKPLNTQYRQLKHVSVGAQHREVRKPTHKIPPRKTRRGPWEQLDSVRLTWANTRSPLGRQNSSTMTVQSHLVRRPYLPPD